MRIFEQTPVLIVISVTQIYFGLALLKLVPGYSGPDGTFTNVIAALLLILGIGKLAFKLRSLKKKPKLPGENHES